MKTQPTVRTLCLALGFSALALSSIGCRSSQIATFDTPEDAVQALSDLADSGDRERAAEMFGQESLEAFPSGDAVADREDRRRVRELLEEKTAFEDREDGTKVILFGDDAWPFPFPLRRVEGGWIFDGEAGREEILNRRVGRNELLTLATLHAIVRAQREYAAEGRDGNPPSFAQKFMSEPGRHDGLYWFAAEGEPESPMGPLVAAASAEGYRLEGGDPAPYHGYWFRMLTSQGKSAPGGERSYIGDRGLLTGGFAAVAWPATYGSSGIMTFQVNQFGIVFEKDLGPDTGDIASKIERFDPDATWHPTGD